MKDLLKTFWATLGVIAVIALLLGSVCLIGLIFEACPTPSPVVKIILWVWACFSFVILFCLIHLIRHPGRSDVDDLYDDVFSPDSESPKIKAEFKECDSCASKPGSPILCKGCLQNRETIHRLSGLND